MRLLGVGTPKATRLVRLAGWAPPEPRAAARRPGPRSTPAPPDRHRLEDPSPAVRRQDDKDDNVSLLDLRINPMTSNAQTPTHSEDQSPDRHLSSQPESAERLRFSRNSLQEQYTPMHHDQMGRAARCAARAQPASR